jgi:uncharacterized protein YcfL
MRTLSFLGVICTALLLSACSNPEIVKLSPDTYMLSRQDRGGIFGNASALKAGVIRDADAFAESQGKVAIPISSNESPMWPGHFASFDYQFRVVDKNDPEARRTSLTPRPNIVVEKDEKVSADIKTTDQSTKQADLYTEIMKLDDLRKKGLLTDAQFEAQKQKLLDKSN